MSVRNDHYLLRNSSEELSSHTDKFFKIKEALFIVKVKVKQSRYRPGVAQRVPGS
jgi:hypothetical protein